MDSVTYQNGTAQNEPLLTENSGISQLKSYLAERIAGAERTLREAQTAELSTRREDLTKRLEHCKSVCHQKIQGLSVKKTSEDLKNLFASAEKNLTGALSCSVTLYGGMDLHTDTKSFEGKNGGELRKAARERVKNFIRKVLNDAKNSTKSVLERAEADYGNVGLNSAYFKKCDEINRILEVLQAALSPYGVHLNLHQEIQVQPDVSDLSSELARYKDDSTYWTANEYFDVFENRIEENKYENWYEEQGLFGIVKRTPKYVIYIHDATYEIQEEISKTFYGNMDDAKNWIDKYYWQPFLKELRSQATKRLTEMRKAAETLALETGQTAEKTYQTALEHLAALQREVSQ